jgi:hypothetical protein
MRVRTAGPRAQVLLPDAERGLEHDLGRPRQAYVCVEQLAPDVDAHNDHASGLRIHTSDIPGVSASESPRCRVGSSWHGV